MNRKPPAKILSENFPAAIARGKHLFPFRTQKLSLSASMVLPGQLGGRVDRCRDKFQNPDPSGSGFFLLTTKRKSEGEKRIERTKV
jgi:hypothetical protein